MDLAELQAFGARYTAAWNSQDPSSVAEYYEAGGSLQINDGDPCTTGALT